MRANANYQVVYWKDVRNEVKAVNSELADIIDHINPNNNYPLIKANYQYGDFIVEKGKTRLPTKHGLLTTDDSRIEKSVQEMLTYSPLPFGLFCNKISENFVVDGNRSIPTHIIKPGNTMGKFETLDYMFNHPVKPIWNVTAGCRTTFTLPKISDRSSIKRLRLEYHLPQSFEISSLYDHWELFKGIVKNSPDDWTSTVILFSTNWFKRDKSTTNLWHQLDRFIFKQAWLQIQYAIEKINFSLLWQTVISKIREKNLKPSTYLADTIKHLLAIANGSTLAFVPADDSEIAIPTKTIQSALIDVYRLKSYEPTIMHPELLSNMTSSLYYSLSLPTLLEGTPTTKQTSSTMMLDLRNLKTLIEAFLETSSYGANFLVDTQFDYFHTDKDIYEEITSSEEIIKLDKNFSSLRYSDRKFCNTSTFWRGCIKISKK